MLGIEMATRVGLTVLYLLLAVVAAASIAIALWLRGYERRQGSEAGEETS